MSSSYIIDAVSERVIQDLSDIDPSSYDIQDDVDLMRLTQDSFEPIFFQYCINHNLDTDNRMTLKSAISCFMDYFHHAMLDTLIEDYDPEEDLT